MAKSSVGKPGHSGPKGGFPKGSFTPTKGSGAGKPITIYKIPAIKSSGSKPSK